MPEDADPTTPSPAVGSTRTLDEVLGEIAAERRAQDAKWGEQNHPDADPVILRRLTYAGGAWRPDRVAQRLAEEYEIPTGRRARLLCQQAAGAGQVTWAHILIEEVAEAVDATVEPDESLLRGELIQAAAVLVAWIEALDRRQAATAGETGASDG